MRNRIFGVETEYAIKHYPDEGSDLKRKLLAEADLFELLNRAASCERERRTPISETRHEVTIRRRSTRSRSGGRGAPCGSS